MRERVARARAPHAQKPKRRQIEEDTPSLGREGHPLVSAEVVQRLERTALTARGGGALDAERLLEHSPLRGPDDEVATIARSHQPSTSSALEAAGGARTRGEVWRLTLEHPTHGPGAAMWRGARREARGASIVAARRADAGGAGASVRQRWAAQYGLAARSARRGACARATHRQVATAGGAGGSSTKPPSPSARPPAASREMNSSGPKLRRCPSANVAHLQQRLG